MVTVNTPSPRGSTTPVSEGEDETHSSTSPRSIRHTPLHLDGGTTCFAYQPLAIEDSDLHRCRAEYTSHWRICVTVVSTAGRHADKHMYSLELKGVERKAAFDSTVYAAWNP